MLTVNQKTGEIFLYGVVGDGMGDDSFSSLDVIDALASLGSKRASIRINSPGGVADEGIAIYNAIKRHKGGADTFVDALAASAASVIALAGENRTTSPGARWMIHRAMTLDAGNATQLRKTADTLEMYDRSLVEIYSQYSPAGIDIMEMLDAETWFTGPESVSIGFSTKIGVPTGQKAAMASWFTNAPENMESCTESKPFKKSYCAFVKAKEFRTKLLTTKF